MRGSPYPFLLLIVFEGLRVRARMAVEARATVILVCWRSTAGVGWRLWHHCRGSRLECADGAPGTSGEKKEFDGKWDGGSGERAA